MLLVGAFYGRAGGLILLGLLATVAIAGATAADQWDGEQIRADPDDRRRGRGQLRVRTPASWCST